MRNGFEKVQLFNLTGLSVGPKIEPDTFYNM